MDGLGLNDELLEIMIALMICNKCQVLPIELFRKHYSEKALGVDGKVIAAGELERTANGCGDAYKLTDVGKCYELDIVVIERLRILIAEIFHGKSSFHIV